MSRKASNRSRGGLPPMAALALAVAAAAAVALAWLIAPTGDGTGGILVALPADAAPEWGAAWGSRMASPGRIEAEALSEGVGQVAVGVAALALLALLTALLRVIGLREAVRPALAVRWAVGASPRVLAREILGRARPSLMRATLFGAAAGLGCAWILHASWPVDGAGRPPSLVLLALLPMACALVALASASPVAGLAARSVPLLRTGSGGTDDPRAGTVRRAAATLQLAAAVALVLAGATLGADARTLDDGATGVGGDTLLVPLRPLTAGVDWGAVERLLGATAPESLSTPGAWTGHGVRDLVTVECGACSRGGLPLPMYGVAATVHAVSPGFFAGADMRVTSGRGFGPDDGPSASPVGVVTAPFARDHFEDGRPLGKRIRLGGPGDRWVTVVGVVEPLPYQAPGSAPPGDPVLYLPLAQHAAERVMWAVPGATARAPEPTPAAAVRVAGDATTVAGIRQRARAPLRWFGWTLLATGVTALALALGGAAEVAGAEARGRWREAAVRAAVGAPPHRLVLRFLRRVTVTALLASAVGSILAWSLVASAGRGAALEPAAGLGLAGLLLVATLAGAARPARHAARADPAALLREGG